MLYYVQYVHTLSLLVAFISSEEVYFGGTIRGFTKSKEQTVQRYLFKKCLRLAGFPQEKCILFGKRLGV